MEDFDFGLFLYSSEEEEYSFGCALVIKDEVIFDWYQRDYHAGATMVCNEFLKRRTSGAKQVLIHDKKDVYDILLKMIPHLNDNQKGRCDKVNPFFRSEKIKKCIERRTPTHPTGEWG